LVGKDTHGEFHLIPFVFLYELWSVIDPLAS
jgi:hypothetical protein